MEFFFDDNAVDSSRGLDRCWHEPRKHSDNPVLAPDRPWEGSVIWPHHALLWDEEDGVYKCWYHTGNSWPTGGDESYLAYATSTDGIAWDKPEFRRVTVDGSERNNLVMPLPIIETFTWSIVKDLRENDPSRRYKSMGFDYLPADDGENGPSSRIDPTEGEIASTACNLAVQTGHSPDGLDWRRDEGVCVFPKGVVADGDFVHGFDEELGRWVAVFRMRTSPKRRFLCRSESADFLHWTFPRMILAPDVDETSDVNCYGMAIHRRGTHRIGFLWIYYSRPDSRHIESQLVYSRDGWNWIRCAERRPILTYERDPAAWDCGMVYPLACFDVEDEFRMYYRGANHIHDAPPEQPQPRYGTMVDGRPVSAAMGIATMTKDRFVGLRAEREGVLTTRFFVAGSDHIVINARTRAGGAITYELLDHLARPVEGYARTDCDPFRGDAVRNGLTWNGSGDLRPLLGRGQEYGRVGYVLALRFYLESAELFSFDVTQPPCSGPTFPPT